jgi:glycosyltransferase involved in cell wall biosynthesis
MRLVASMIVRNELDRYLQLSIDHLLTFCDEVRILDDHSTDGTFEWLGSYNKPAIVKLNPGLSFFEHEGVARQALLEWTMLAKPDYVLSIDADEFVGDPDFVQEALTHGWDSYTLMMDEVWSATPEKLRVRVDGLWGRRPCPILWRAPSTLGGDWVIADRKLACGREPLAVRHTRRKPSGSLILHFGWARRAERDDRAERYAIHDRGAFHSNEHLQSILWPDEKVQLAEEPWPVGLEPLATKIAERAGRP